MAVALASRGGGGSASELRSDAGIFFGYGVEETLKRHIDLMTQETIIVSRPWTAQNTSTTTFSFAQDHYIQDIVAIVTADPANLEWLQLTALDPAGAITQSLLFGEVGNLIVPVSGSPDIGGAFALAVMIPPLITTFPRFGKRQLDYTFHVRGDAAGTGTARLVMSVTRCPEGVEIPH